MLGCQAEGEEGGMGLRAKRGRGRRVSFFIFFYFKATLKTILKPFDFGTKTTQNNN
jgi:hypothetical protein